VLSMNLNLDAPSIRRTLDVSRYVYLRACARAFALEGGEERGTLFAEFLGPKSAPGAGPATMLTSWTWASVPVTMLPTAD